MENEMRLIDVNAVNWGRCPADPRLAKAWLDEAPTVDARPVVHGRWIEKVDMVESYLEGCTEVFYECSVCECANIGESPYCPNCGSQMDGGDSE